ncbi:MAG TPA: hypothetical protein VIJ93_09255 [bacterium]
MTKLNKNSIKRLLRDSFLLAPFLPAGEFWLFVNGKAAIRGQSMSKPKVGTSNHRPFLQHDREPAFEFNEDGKPAFAGRETVSLLCGIKNVKKMG